MEGRLFVIARLLVERRLNSPFQDLQIVPASPEDLHFTELKRGDASESLFLKFRIEKLRCG